VKKLLFFFLLAVLAGATFYGVRKNTGARLVALETVKVKRGKVRKVISATGIVKPQVGAEIKVGARISGTVVKENVRVGDFVKKGDLIAVIDNREPKEELKRARAKLEEVERTYPERIAVKKLKLKEALKKLRIARAKLKAEKENFSLRQWELERQERLFASGYTTQHKLRQARLAFEQAKSSLKVAEEELERAKIGVKVAERELKEAEERFKAELASARANLERARIRYSYSFIYAPKSGIISFVSTQEGETVVAGLNAPQFVTILDPEKLENWIYVDETEIGKVSPGMEVEFTVDTYRGKVFHAKVEEIYPKPERHNNVIYYIVVARGFESPHLLRPEMTTHNSIVAGVKEGVLVVPNSAVKWRNGRYVVYRVENRTVKEAEVKVGWSDDKFTEILSGLREGDTVALKIGKR
jgi:HlyD family secretion protein/macrolide-specific efflux system membrane fusion protein